MTPQERLDKVTIKDIAAAIEVIKAREAGLPNDPRAMTWCIQFQEVAYPTNSVLARMRRMGAFEMAATLAFGLGLRRVANGTLGFGFGIDVVLRALCVELGG